MVQYTRQYSDTLVSAAGCDSVATLVLHLRPVTASSTSVVICSNQLPYAWNNRLYAEAGIYRDTLTGADGCDSIATLVLAVTPVAKSITAVTVSESQLPYRWNNHTYLAAGTYADTLTGASGCDSVASLELTLNPVLRNILTVSICNNQLPYNWNGKAITAAGRYSDTLRSVSGYDSVATLVLSVQAVSTSTVTAAVCDNQLPYSWKGKAYTVSGVYTDTLNNAAGCDSVVTLLMTVRPKAAR